MLSHKLLPVLFLSHGGGPAHRLDYGGSRFADIDKNSKSAEFLRNLPKLLEKSYNTAPSDIRCILVITAHWEESEFTVDYQNHSDGSTKLIYDYYGFPPEAYAPLLTYPVPTDLAVADRVAELLQSRGLKVAKKDRGFDHGTFMPLSVAFPAATIPVVQLSLKSNLSPAEHFQLGEVLRPLRREGVLIVGSGQITHNLRVMGEAEAEVKRKSLAFTDFLFEQVSAHLSSQEDYQRFKQLFIAQPEKVPNYAFAHPRIEHFLPFLVAVGAGSHSPDEVGAAAVQGQRIYSELVLGSMAVDTYLFQ